MARRRLLSDEQLAPFWAWASDERAMVRHYTLSQADLDLGFVVLAAALAQHSGCAFGDEARILRPWPKRPSGALIKEVRFAVNSPLEGRGFELSVPLQKPTGVDCPGSAAAGRREGPVGLIIRYCLARSNRC